MSKLIGICHDQLNNNRVVKEYLNKRGITQKTIDKFLLGAFPYDLRILLKTIDIELLKECGIIWQADKSPFFHYPLIIPICDVNGNFIGIGGRSMASNDELKSCGFPKYKNSVYDKVDNLFGLYQAKQSIREKNVGIIVEGYFDVITSHQNGLDNVVATSGTLLSPKQLTLLSRYCQNIKLLFDNDEAGKKASKKLFEKHKEIDGINLEELFLPNDFKDIDELLSKEPLSTIFV